MKCPFFRRYPSPSVFEKKSSSIGFSLIEVLLAIGIISFAFMALVGLIPVGLNIFRESMDTSVGGRIVQQIVNEAQQTDFDTLLSSATVERYFDEQGSEVTQSESVYTVQMTVLSSTEIPGASNPSTNLATIVVKVAYNPAHQSLSGSKKYPTYSALVARATPL